MDKAYYEQNKEKINARRRERYKNDPIYHARRAEEARRNKKKYPEKFKLQRERYYQKHKEKFAIRSRAWMRAHPEKVREYNMRQKEKYRSAIYGHYGEKCNCCGETQIKFLTIDHVNNDGYKERRYDVGYKKMRVGGTAIYPKIINAGYPDSYQILCMNCNFGKAQNKGICPHKILLNS